MKRNMIVNQYVRTWFLVDLISSFPYPWLLTNDLNKDFIDTASISYRDSAETTFQAP
jgi:hypothetical protein